MDCVSFANNILVCGQSRKEGNIWDVLVSTETSASIHKTIAAGVGAVACSASTGKIFVGRDDGNLSIFSDSLEDNSTISAHDDIITAMSIDAFNDSQCVTVSWDGQISLIDCASSKIDVIAAHSGIIYGVAHSVLRPGVFSTIGQDSFLRLWDNRNLHEGCTSLLPLNQTGCSCCWSSQSEYLIACGMEDGNIHVVDTRTNSFVTSKLCHEGRITKIVSPHNNSRAVPSDDFFISASVDKSICSQTFDMVESHNNRISSSDIYTTDITWADELAGRSALVGSMSDGSVRIVDENLILQL
eukprot:CAMPEP_0114460790 /NCGR_PEP_ID=MMETSP0104-20121206/5934_1 /TAXON_ID=37642 ORGANISM="Paraphysomonas imperforata, Strain PA2" /NCGR_SAMPLE_ID=MMETSP0104 /ASSEMBLY_ACC=CAM_ASM_000202 /LENGTH=298 /DNA_ID=CAMNT_0001633527 /DNA_START=83 /DNA_END=979 /DNA_ORIENTATION=-